MVFLRLLLALSIVEKMTSQDSQESGTEIEEEDDEPIVRRLIFNGWEALNGILNGVSVDVNPLKPIRGCERL
jgi:hypothetical protein